MNNALYNLLNLKSKNDRGINAISVELGISVERIKYLNESNLIPVGKEISSIAKYLNMEELAVKLSLGYRDTSIMQHLSKYAPQIADNIDFIENSRTKKKNSRAEFSTKLGKLYHGDCLDVMKAIDDDHVDLIFADPPFNLDKFYLSNINDKLTSADYLEWCEKWLYECIRVLKPGGSLFVWNLPKWNATLSSFIGQYLTFKHWISVDMKFSLPIQGRLYPSHYSLLYFTKGDKPNTFHPDRLKMETCPKCYTDLKDYGGYKNKMNPKGINLCDVWYDIPPVRHAKYKKRKEANELSLKLMDRIIELGSEEGDLVLDPFGGSGTTYVAAELKKRRWIGMELGPIDQIIERFSQLDEEKEYLGKLRREYNQLFPPEIKKARKAKGLWTDEDFTDRELGSKNNLLSKKKAS